MCSSDLTPPRGWNHPAQRERMKQMRDLSRACTFVLRHWQKERRSMRGWQTGFLQVTDLIKALSISRRGEYTAHQVMEMLTHDNEDRYLVHAELHQVLKGPSGTTSPPRRPRRHTRCYGTRLTAWRP